MLKRNKKAQAEKNRLYEAQYDDNTSDFEKDILTENPPKLSYLVRLFHYVFSSARLMCGIFLGLAIILSVLQPITAFLWGRYIDGANLYAESSEPQLTRLLPLVGLLILYWLIRYINNLLNRYLYGAEDIERLSKVQDHRLQEKFRAKLFKKISLLYPDYMEVPKINEMIDRCFSAMGGEWSSLQRGVIIEGYVIIAKAVSVIAVAVSLYVFHPFLCFIVLAAPIPTLYTTYIGNKLRFKFSRDNTGILRKADYYQGVLLGTSAKEVKALNLFDFFFGKWKLYSDDYVVNENKNQRNIFALGMMSSFISNTVNIAANVFAVVLMARGKLTIGALGASLALISTLMGSTSQLFSSIANFISKKNEAAQFFEFIDLNEQAQSSLDSENTEKQINIEKIEAKNLSYRYPLTNEYRIKNVNFTINKGEKIAFVGENGAGKTTFVKLLTGMLEPSGGDILINNIGIKNINRKTEYNALSCVFQEPAKFNTFTVADNVFLGDAEKERNEERINESLGFSGFRGAEKDAVLGKDIGGTDLSGGQWQKIAIARAQYRYKDFIVLDEPTSNLDPIAEAEIFKKYIAMAEGKTVITVTHRISVASLADRVIVFKDGEIVEDGTHNNLLSNNGEYSKLYLTQSQWYNR